MESKLVVEFGVEKEIKRDYGYVEKYLLFRGEATPYKAIVRNNELLAIVSKRYQLIENEKVVDICNKIASQNGYVMDVVSSPTRVYIFLDANDVGAVVQNSVDGSLSLRVDAVVRINGGRAIIRVKNVKEIYKKHFGGVKIVVNDLEQIIKEILKYSKEFKSMIDKLDKLSAREYVEEIKTLEGLLPKRYVSKVLQVVLQRTLSGGTLTLKNVYERIACDIWSANIDIKTKIQYFDDLNNVMLALVGWS